MFHEGWRTSARRANRTKRILAAEERVKELEQGCDALNYKLTKLHSGTNDFGDKL
jgi:hypothetical protein